VNIIRNLSIYDNPIETFLKTVAITISALIAHDLLVSNYLIDIKTAGIGLFIYSISLMMEFLTKLNEAENFIRRLFPVLIAIPAAFMFVSSVGFWSGVSVNIPFCFQKFLIWFPIVLLVLDFILRLIIWNRKPEDGIENQANKFRI